MVDSAKPQDKAPAVTAKPEITSAYTVTNNSTRHLSIYHDGIRLEFTPLGTSEMQLTEEAAQALGESLKRFPGVIVSITPKKAG